MLHEGFGAYSLQLEGSADYALKSSGTVKYAWYTADRDLNSRKCLVDPTGLHPTFYLCVPLSNPFWLKGSRQKISLNSVTVIYFLSFTFFHQLRNLYVKLFGVETEKTLSESLFFSPPLSILSIYFVMSYFLKGFKNVRLY